MQRRDLLKVIPLLMASCASPVSMFTRSPSSRRIMILPFYNFANGKNGVFGFDFSSRKATHVEIFFDVHNVYFDEVREELIGINKYGPDYVRFNGLYFAKLRYGKIDESRFKLSGHVASVDGDENYYLTATSSTTYESCIIALNKKSGECSLVANLGKSDPPVHDCKFAHQSDELVATNFNKIHYYNRNTKKLRSKVINLTEAESSLRHFSLNQKNEICLQSNVIHTNGNYRYQDAEVVFFANDEADTQLVERFDARVANNELLDFSFDVQGKNFACVHSGSRFLSLWSAQPLIGKKLIEFPEPISRVMHYFDEELFLVLGQENFYLLNPDSFKISKLNIFENFLKKDLVYNHKTLIWG